MNELAKSYDPATVEPSWAENWAKPGTFRADANSSKPAFTIVIPPPNINGSLHLGHALDNTIIDTITRYKRLAGFEALYLPGMDHAGITTQVMVEKELALEGKTRQELGREKFLERVWEFKERNGGTILQQLTRLGISADWSRERFTMDAGLSRAVRRTFVEYFHKGLAYRGERIVHWDPVAQTVLSDLEVDREDRQGKMYTVAYRFEDGPVDGIGDEIQVATVRPETIFADMAVAIHPDDDRASHLQGKKVVIPLTNRAVPIILDEAVEKDFGTATLKVTPAHDPTDFEIGKRHNLEKPSILDGHAKMTGDLVPEEFRGLDRFEARKRVTKALEESGALREVKDHKISLGISERTKEPVEPMVMTQWWCNMQEPARKVLESLDAGEMKLVPERWLKVNRDWLENIREWAIGRQLWWGHQLPAWYDEDGKLYVPDLANPDLDCDQDPRYAHLNLTRDSDVFDTWFSSALWPFSTLGWPDDTADFRKFYPNDVMVTGYDILFFWVARMQMSGLEFIGKAPFRTIVLHGLYLDAKGQKMSKSKNNGIDPLVLIEKYGADACRFAWAYLATGGQDIKHDERRYEQGRNFANKVFNASKFVMMNLAADSSTANNSLPLADRWIKGRLSETIHTVTRQLDEFDLAAAIRTVYSFTWDEFCDWYLEAAKPAMREGNTATKATLKQVLECILKMLHPFMPFITSEIYATLNPEAPQLSLQAWPVIEEWDNAAMREFGFVKDAISSVRSLRAELNLSPAQAVTVSINGDGLAAVMANLETFTSLARADLGEISGKTIANITPGLEVRVGFEGLVDEGDWLEKAKKRAVEFRKQIQQAQGKLSNQGFVARAPNEVIEEEKRRVEDFGSQLERLEAVLAQF